jgi:glyoxylase-like metal-dependent hydrolase (beta-lactamase superfamily II)
MKRKDFIKQSAALLALSSVDALASPENKIASSKQFDMEQSKVCGTCGTHYPSPSHEICEICNDDRQYIPEGGQVWTTHDQLLKNNSVRILKLHEKVYELQIKPTFGIGQRTLLILSEQGNILWDCIPLLNEPTIDFINSKGGLKAIAFSHPHYYSNMNDWAEAFNCPIYIHHTDEQWIINKGKHITLWNGAEKTLWHGMKIMNIGGHFPGSSILHVPFLSEDGAIFCGDTLTIAPSKKHIAVMYSYPNRIPLPLKEMERIKKRLETIPFDKMYGFYSDQNLLGNVKEVIKKSFARYV